MTPEKRDHVKQTASDHKLQGDVCHPAVTGLRSEEKGRAQGRLKTNAARPTWKEDSEG